MRFRQPGRLLLVVLFSQSDPLMIIFLVMIASCTQRVLLEIVKERRSLLHCDVFLVILLLIPVWSVSGLLGKTL